VGRSLRRSKKAISTVVAEVLMVLIVIILSAIVYAWVLPTFTSSEVQGNNGAAYAEKFSTLWGNFATFATNIPETVVNCGSQDGGVGCSPNSYHTCAGSISSPDPSNIVVPANGVCVITANVGNVYARPGSNLTIIGATINGGLETDHAAIVTLRNAKVTGFSGFYTDGAVIITGSSLNTSGYTGICTDACFAAAYEGGSGPFTMVNSTVTGQIESEVSSKAVVTGNTVTARLEIESAVFGQVTNNKIGMLDMDQNGIMVVSGNTVYGNDPYFNGVWVNGQIVCQPGTATAICFGYNGWCAQGNDVVIAGTHNEVACIGNIEIDLSNTGSTPVNLVAAYMSNVALSGPISWKLFSGGTVHHSLPITIPVGQSANVTMQWTPPPGLTTLPWTDIYFIFVSSHGNFVDGHIYFGYDPALTVPSQSRPQNQVCPPCY